MNGDRGCVRCREWISLRADGELSELERLLLERHLGRCQACTEFAAGVEAVTSLLRETEPVTPGREVEPVVPGPRPLWRRGRYRVAAVAAAAAVAAGVAGFLVTGENGQSPTPRPVIDIAEAPSGPPELPEPPTTVEKPV